jgi:hypothetical protein
MANFKPEALLDKLTKLNTSQQSIETVSAWCQFYRKVVPHQRTPFSLVGHCEKGLGS